MTSEVDATIHQCQCQVCQTATDAETVRRHQQINVFLSRLTEPQRRWYVALVSEEADSPSDRQLSLITGLDEKTIQRGRRELESGLNDVPPNRQRRVGGGRPRAEKRLQP